MEKQQLLNKLKYYKIKTDKATLDFIKTRLVSISHRIETHSNGNEHKIYHFEELIPYGKRAYKGSGVYKAYNAILDAMAEAKQRGNELRAEARDIKNNPDKYASDTELMKIFNCVGKSGITLK